MASLLMVIGSIVVFIIAYATYGSWLAQKWGVDSTRKTPAHEINDGVDYVPTSSAVLLGHHFSSIAGAGPINGPIQAAIFGWVPVLLWIVIGSIFFGGVHDFGSLFVSIRHKGKSIGEVINDTMGQKGKKLFSIFAWLTLLLIVAAFSNIVASTFASTPEAATSSLLFMILAIGFGYAVYRKGVSLKVGTVVGVILLFVCVWLGTLFPLQLSVNTWIVILAIYIFIASTAPVWILLQPRDYLNSFLLYAMMIGAVLGIIIYRPEIKLDAITAFKVVDGNNVQYLFPMLFVTVACGAISGFHSLVASGTTSKQIDNEKDSKKIGYGGMLIEGALAVIALITAAYLTQGELSELLKDGPVNVFSNGIGVFMSKLGIPFETGKTFVALAVSAFALTSLDTATRLGRFIFQEYFEDPEKETQSSLTNMYVSTLIIVVLASILASGGYAVIWPIFGSANQLLSALALMAVALWLKKSNKSFNMITIPMIFMLVVTLSALVLLIKNNFIAANYVLVVLPILLFILAIVLAVEGYKILFKKDTKVSQQMK
ncbi:carbon starvation protein [Keratinibaculum paraultunense]|uniref:Carbon starvation protein n=1 Tax=Keratinibaculum paraultunense TaxID=1278232 RepID=A0A4R3L2B7_9FIRM|nr:carbon starvation protein A [Keratinibaculum paraultunense]QQY78972.1 carbon starvation protein A [Keratinibaculum paraultunense]TCS90592.1 carbon starvation protein [Keratinibaculum paraultunense]